MVYYPSSTEGLIPVELKDYAARFLGPRKIPYLLRIASFDEDGPLRWEALKMVYDEAKKYGGKWRGALKRAMSLILGPQYDHYLPNEVLKGMAEKKLEEEINKLKAANGGSYPSGYLFWKPASGGGKPMNIVLESERHGLGSGLKEVYPDEDPENPDVVFATTPVNYCDFVLSHPDFSPELRHLAQEHLDSLNIVHTHMEDWNLNLPSFRACFEVNQHGRFDINEDLTRTLEREVTFVGDTAANFKCEIVNPDENLLKLDIEIDDNMDSDDKELKFWAYGDKRKFRVSATVLDFLYAELLMKADGYVTSRCPIVVVKIPRTSNVVVS